MNINVTRDINVAKISAGLCWNYRLRRSALLTVLLALISITLSTQAFAQSAANSLTQPATSHSTEFVLSTPDKSSLLTPPVDGGPVIVKAFFDLQDINEIDELAETFEFTGVLTLTWKDQRQAFDPEEAQTEEKVYQGSYQFNELSPAWYPQVILVNESGLYEKHSVLLRVKPDGTSILVETVNAVAEANLDLRRCPFDSQRLAANFEVLGFDSSEVVFETVAIPPSTKSKKIKISQWFLTNLSSSVLERSFFQAGTQKVSSSFVLTIDAQRRSFFLLRLVVVPLLLIVLLSWSVFWMDRSSLGDRINVSFIGVLTVVAYQLVMAESLPQISYMTLIHGFINISFFFMCATVIINLIVGSLDKRGKFERGDRVDHYCRRIVPVAYFSLLSFMVLVAFVFF